MSNKILHIANYRSNRANGAFKVIENICNSLYEQNYDVELWGMSESKDNNDYPFYRHFEINIFSFFLSQDLKEAILSKKDEIAYVQLHSVFLPINTALSRFLNKHNIKTVLMPHGGYNPYTFKRSSLKKRLFYYLFEKFHIERIDKFYLHGRAEYNFINKIKSIDRSFIPNGITIPEESPLVEFDESDTLKLLIIARKDYQHKGIDLLLRAIARCRFREKIKLIMVGPDYSSKHKKIIEDIISKYSLHKNVEILPKVMDSDKKEKLYKEADLFAHTSRWEGMPMAVLEAISAGLPPFVTENTNLGPYISNFNAGYVTNLRIDEISETLDDIVAHKLNIKPMIMKCVEMADEVFDWNRISKETANYFMAEFRETEKTGV